MTLRQVHFAMVDLDLHTSFVPGEGESIFDRDRKVGCGRGWPWVGLRQGRNWIILVLMLLHSCAHHR